MKNRIHQRLARWGLALLAGLCAQPMLTQAATTDLADKPLFAAKGTLVKPNVLFVLDDSGSMAWDFMPDDTDYDGSWNNATNREYTRNKYYGRRASQCNGVAFNPVNASKTYITPVDATGTKFLDASTDFLSGAKMNGDPNYLSSGYVWLTTGHNLVSARSVSTVQSTGSVTVTVGTSFSNYYVGMVVSLINAKWSSSGYAWDDSGYMIGKVTAWNATSRTLTIGVEMGVGVGTTYADMYVGVGSPIDNVYYVYKGTEAPHNYDHSTGPLNKTTTFYQECASQIGSAPGKAVFEAVIVKPTGSTAEEKDLIKAYANWYKYYSTRMSLMKTSMTHAFLSMNSDVRVGFDSINRNTGEALLDVKDFDLDHKKAFYARVNGAVTGNSTPLRAALSQAGRYYAKKLKGQTYDPVQYSCQRNYTLLSTDGYWNSSAGYKLDGVSAVGQQDGLGTPTPYYDGGNVDETLKETWTVKSSQLKTSVTPYERTDTKYTATYSNAGQQYVTYTLDFMSGKCSGGKGLLTKKVYTRDEVTKNELTSTTKSTWTSTRVDEVNVTITTYNRTAIYKDRALVSDETTSTTATAPDAWVSGPTKSIVASTTDDVSKTGISYTPWVSKVTTSCTTTKPADVGSEASPTSVPPTTATSKPISTTSTTDDVAGTTTTSLADPALVTSDKTATTSTGSQDSLADVAMYYYKTDLRTTGLANCTGALGTPVCDNNVAAVPGDPANWQHMNTYTFSLGMNGRLSYTPDYETNISSIYAKIKSGDMKWPVPDGGAANIDDLWHAAVNGRGRYFSTSESTSLAASLKSALDDAGKVTGSSSAASTSTLQPVEGDKGVYVAQFEAVTWQGDLQAFEINPTTGEITSKVKDGLKPLPMWSARSMLASAPERKIYYKSTGSGAVNGLKEFTFANLDADGLGGNFSGACSKTPVLTQCADATTEVEAILNSGDKMVSFLRGQPVDQFRVRASILGDIVNSSPVYVSDSKFNYTDSGYSKFKTDQALRRKTLYVGANDGMLHAFDADTGAERWAYVPRMVMANLYRLGERNYGGKHFYSVDATPVVGDIYDGSKWRTILVAGLNGGGKGYFALDITNPTAPEALWEFTNANLGFSYGNPVITKRKDGTWVVAFTSGYNNADGDGHLFVVKAVDGSLLADIKTGAGSSGSPSGLGKLNAWVDVDTDNTAARFYAGDLLGNVWRFDVDGVLDAAKPVVKLAQLVKGGMPQPITTRLELAEIEASGGKHVVVYVGTGRYLGETDIANEEVQSVYAIADDLGKTGLGDVRSTGVLVKQTLTTTDGVRTIDPPEPVDWSAKKGWYVDLPDVRERVNVDMQLAFNKLTVAGNVPNNSPADCDGAGGGKAWLYQLDVVSGKLTNGESISAMVAGLSSVQLSDGTGVTLVTETNATILPKIGSPSSSSGGKARRSSWRELID